MIRMIAVEWIRFQNIVDSRRKWENDMILIFLLGLLEAYLGHRLLEKEDLLSTCYARYVPLLGKNYFSFSLINP